MFGEKAIANSIPIMGLYEHIAVVKCPSELVNPPPFGVFDYH